MPRPVKVGRVAVELAFVFALTANSGACSSPGLSSGTGGTKPGERDAGTDGGGVAGQTADAAPTAGRTGMAATGGQGGSGGPDDDARDGASPDTASGGAGGGSTTAATGGRVDTLILGDPASESAHALAQSNTQSIVGALGQTSRQCLPASPAVVNGGDLTFTMKVDPVRRNHVTVKFWGGDATDTGRLYLYVVAGGVSYQVGYRHEGDYPPLNVAATKAALPGRFFYSTSLLPLAMTFGKTSLALRIVSTGRIYPLGSGVAPAGNYQFLMAAPSRSIYRVYTHTDALMVPTGESQGAAPMTTVRPSPGAEVMSAGGSFFNAVNNRVNGRLAATVDVTTFTTADALYLARAYSVSGLTAYHSAALVARVAAVIDAFARDFYANGSAAVSGGNQEGWGGRYGNLGWAIHLLLPQFGPSVDATVNYGATGGSKTRRAAWGEMMAASRDFGRTTRDARYITNQSLLANASIFMANQGLLDLGDSAAFPPSAALRYLREAIGLAPWLGSDLPGGGGSSNRFGTQYFQVTRKGLTREWGYVGISYGEMQWHAANFFAWTGDAAFRAQAIKMEGARAAFRRPAIDLGGPAGTAYRAMEGIGLLAWRGAPESDGNFADELAYGDRTGGGAVGMRVAAATLDPGAVGHAKQMLGDNQYFSTLGNALIADPMVLEAFADYQAVNAAPDSGARLPMTDGQPDFAWADEEDGIVAVKRGGDRLWIAPYFQAKTGTGINGVARFHYSTSTWDQYGLVETNPQFEYAATFVRSNLIDKPETNFYVPPDNPTQAYAGERLPLAASELVPAPADANGANYAPFRGRANFYALQLGGYVIGLNMSPTLPAVLRLPPGMTSADDLVSGKREIGDVAVAPLSTVVLYAASSGDRVPVPTAPLLVEVSGATRNQLTVGWTRSSGAASYTVKRATLAGGPYVTAATRVVDATYTDTGLGAGASYFYQVSAVNPSGESYDSMKATAKTAP